MVMKADNAIIKEELCQCHSRFSKAIFFHKTKVVRLEKRNDVVVEFS